VRQSGTYRDAETCTGHVGVQSGKLDGAHQSGSGAGGIPNRLPEAVAEYQAALRLKPDNAQTYADLGNALAQMPGGCQRRLASSERRCG